MKSLSFFLHYFIWYASGFLNVGAFLVLMSYAINHDNFLIFSSVSTLSLLDTKYAITAETKRTLGCLFME